MLIPSAVDKQKQSSAKLRPSNYIPPYCFLKNSFACLAESPTPLRTLEVIIAPL